MHVPDTEKKFVMRVSCVIFNSTYPFQSCCSAPSSILLLTPKYRLSVWRVLCLLAGILYNEEHLLKAKGKNLPDTVIMNLKMPIMDGGETTTEIKKKYTT